MGVEHGGVGRVYVHTLPIPVKCECAMIEESRTCFTENNQIPQLSVMPLPWAGYIRRGDDLMDLGKRPKSIPVALFQKHVSVEGSRCPQHD